MELASRRDEDWESPAGSGVRSRLFVWLLRRDWARWVYGLCPGVGLGWDMLGAGRALVSDD